MIQRSAKYNRNEIINALYTQAHTHTYEIARRETEKLVSLASRGNSVLLDIKNHSRTKDEISVGALFKLKAYPVRSSFNEKAHGMKAVYDLRIVEFINAGFLLKVSFGQTDVIANTRTILQKRIILNDNSFKSNSVYMKGANFNYLDLKSFEDAQALEIICKKNKAVESRYIKKMIVFIYI